MKRGSCTNILSKVIPGRKNIKCKGSGTGMTWMFEGQKVTVGVWTGDNEGENGKRCVEAIGPIVGFGNVLSPHCLQWMPLEGVVRG